MNFFDLHCDTISAIYHNRNKNNYISLANNSLQIDINKLSEAKYFAQAFAMFIWYECENPFEECIKMIDLFYQELSANPKLALALNYDDLIKNYKNNKINAILTIEEGGVCKGNLEYLRTFYKLGVRMITLNWNFINGVGYPNYKIVNNEFIKNIPNNENGLTEFGFMMVKEMNKLGMIVDVSHLSDKGFWDVIKTTNKPIVASHSNARGVCHHVRNLDDDMIIALNENGGVMGMNYCADFMDDDLNIGKNTIECVIRHIKYIKNLVGVDVIALGSDFDGIDPNIKLSDASLMPNLINALKEEGFSDLEIEKICYKNALRVFKANLR